MAHILDLPDEILILVTEALNDDSRLPHEIISEEREFVDWVARKEQLSEARIKQNKDILTMMKACKRLYQINKPLLYQSLAVQQPPALKNLTRSLDDASDLGELIYCVNIPGDESLDFFRLFWLPKICEIAIDRWQDWEASEFSDTKHHRASPVTVLKLANCGAHEEALTELFKWPHALEELWIEVDEGEWGGSSETHPPRDWECAALVRALQPQKDSLQTLVMTRPPPVHEGLGYADRIDLRQFTNLTTLRLFYVYIIGSLEDDPDGPHIRETLPPNIEDLSVYFDDTGYIDFLDPSGQNFEWFLEIAEYKESMYKNLRKVSISSGESGGWREDADEDEPRWVIPESWAKKYEEVGVELRITLGMFPHATWWVPLEIKEVLVWPRAEEKE